jgi:uncharacterized protein with PQ loop repeat
MITDPVWVLIAWIGAFFLALCGLPQAALCWKNGNARGMDPYFLAMWLMGELLMFAYVVYLGDWPLTVNYGLNLVVLLVIWRYKIWPRKYRH